LTKLRHCDSVELKKGGVTMLKEREELEEKLQKQLRIKSTDKNILNKYIQSLIVTGVSEKNAGEIVLLIKPLNIYDDRTIYKLSSLLLSEKEVNSFFTPKEVKEYGKTTKTVGKNVFPIKWKMIQIDDRQFIGKISVEELMRLRDLQLLSYNPNAQRPMKAKEFNGEVIFIPTLNNAAVKAIKELYLENTYIPNTLTLNIPIEETFEYDDVENELIIYKLEHFDILDGYHRFRALSDIYNLDSSFDYPMELRIVSFSDEEARQFIYQEDQKTKMRKVDSESFNQNNYANQIIQELNKYSTVLKGKFNAEYIDPALAGRMINISFLFGVNKMSRKEIIELRNYIEQVFRDYEIYDVELLEKKWEPRYIISFFYAIWKAKESGLDNVYRLVEDVNKYLNEEGHKKNFYISFTRSDFVRLDKVAKEVFDYV